MKQLSWKNQYGRWSAAHIVDHEEEDVIHFVCGQTLDTGTDALDIAEECPRGDVCGRCTKSLEIEEEENSKDAGVNIGGGDTEEVVIDDFDPNRLCSACLYSWRHRNLVWLCRSNDCRHKIGFDRIAKRDGEVIGLE